jgi:glutamate carboxypeptidase
MIDEQIRQEAQQAAAQLIRELEALVAVSSPSGDIAGAEEAIALCGALLPDQAQLQRVACSTSGFAPDLIARMPGTGSRRLMLLGHLDTVVGHDQHARPRRDGNRLYGPGTVDMKGGVILALRIARVLAQRPERYAEVAVLLVNDEEWRTAPFAHVEAFSGYDACLCFEAGERSKEGHDGVVVRRKAATTLRVRATGRSAHSGSAPHLGANALLALARAAIDGAARSDPDGPDRLTVVPTIMSAGGAINVVPAGGELVFDIRAADQRAFEDVIGSLPASIDGVGLEAGFERLWPAMDSERATEGLLRGAAKRLGRPIVARSRGGASDASHFAASIPLTVDGLGPRGDGAHTPTEYVFTPSLRERTEVALALALTALEG